MVESDDMQGTSACGSPATAGCIAEDMPCRLCGYNLRGLESGGKCPECGREIAATLDPLSHLDPVWIAKVVRGMRFLLAGVAYAVACVLIMFVAFEARLLILLWCTGAAAAGFMLVGVCWLTVPEPGSVQSMVSRSRRWTRLAGILFACMSGVNLTLSIMPVEMLLLVIVGLFVVLTVLFQGSLVHYTGLLAQMTGRSVSTRLAGFQKRLFLVIIGMTVLGIMFALIYIVCGSAVQVHTVLRVTAKIAEILMVILAWVFMLVGMVWVLGLVIYLLTWLDEMKDVVQTAREKSAARGTKGSCPYESSMM